MTTETVRDDPQVGPEHATVGGISPVSLQHDRLLSSHSARTVGETGTTFLEVVERHISPLREAPYAGDESANTSKPRNSNALVHLPSLGGGTSSFLKPTLSIQGLNSKFRRLNNRFSTSISSLSDLKKPSYHKRAASENYRARGSLESKKEILNPHKFNPMKSSRHSAPPLGECQGEDTRNETSHELEQQKRKHGHSSSTDDPIHLGDRLYTVLQNDTMNRRLFVPRLDLDKVITQETVERELSRWVYLPARISPKAWQTATPLRIGSSLERGDAKHTLEEQKTMAGPANRSFQQIFTVLLLIDRPKKIWAFLKEGVCDADLPLETVMISQQGRVPFTLECRRGGDSKIQLKCLKKSRDISSFVEKQWLVLVPVFEQSDRKETSHLTVNDQQSLPFVHWKQSGREGSYGEVYQAKIHDDHCKFSLSSAPGNVVAVKRLLRDDSKAFNHESTILRRLLKKPLFHSHLITLLATFEQRGQRYLIFPWAEGDLENYWKSMHSGKDEQLAIWLVRQCQGITEALSHIHRYHTTSGTTMDYKSPDESSAVEPVSATQQTHDLPNIRRPLTLFGRHGDIRPKNILWYHDPANIQDLGTLKLADFGCARFRDTTRMPEEKRSSMAISWTYVSPECMIPDNIPSIQCDVWALGCVFLEFICWYHTGYNGLHTFDRQRIFENASDNFFHIVRHGKPERSPHPYAAVKETVIEKIAELRKLSKSDKGLTDLLDRVENDMLVVQNDGGLSTVLEVDGDENSATHGLLEVPPEPHRRMSSGNIARKLGDTLQLIDPSRRNSTDSTRELTAVQSLPHRTSLQRPRE